MKKAALLSLLILLTAVPSFATTTERHQSFFSYDDGGTVVRQDDGREVEARVNLPVYPGDEVITTRRGRAEIHLSDGNTVAVDRATTLRFLSILDSYEGDGSQTVATLVQGKVAVYRTGFGRDYIRLDSEHASYVASDEAVYSVEADPRGRDRVTVFDGSVEVRTRARSTRLREGESAEIDDQGVFDLVTRTLNTADDFERWFLRRTERAGRKSRYLDDDRLAYWGDDLDTRGRWVQVAGIGWSWRPYVAVGWRPYYNGYWHHSRYGGLVWVSYDPFGFVPYHYGRWAHDPFHGWIWVPGGGYSPAWVYWMYGSNYVGWAPAGWWDCYGPYYNWAYRPYYRTGSHFGFGFYGRVRVHDIDLRPWTFMEPGTLVSTRVDRAALTTDAIKQRLGRGSGGFGTISAEPARFTRDEFRNPADAINRIARRGWGTGTGTTDRGGVASTAPDMTSFVRREADPGAAVRERIVRSRGGSGAAPVTAGNNGPTTRTIGGGGSVAPVDGGGLAPTGRGSVAPIGGGNVAPVGRGGLAPIGDGGSSGRINRGSDDNPGAAPSWRERAGRDTGARSGSGSGAVEAPRGDQPARDDSWRNRVRRVDPPSDSGTRSAEPSSGSDAPRRVIDGIRGARVTPRDDGDDSSTRSRRDSGDDSSARSRRDEAARSRESSRSRERESAPPPRAERPPSDSGRSSAPSRDSGASRDSGSRDTGSARSNDGGSRSEGGRIKRDRD